MTESKRGGVLTLTQRICFIFLALLGLSCSEEPTDQNSPTAPGELPGVTIHDTTIVAIGDSTFKKYIGMDGLNNLVGVAQGYTTLSVLEFYPSAFHLRDTVNVLSATLRLRLTYRSGDAAGLFSFDVYRVSRSWSPSTLTWDSVQTGFYDASIKRGNFSGTITSDTGFISLALDTSMVREWISTTATSDKRYGIILVPTSSSSVRGFRQFASSDSASWYPTLEIIAAGTSGTTQDTSSYSSGMGTFVGDVTLPNTPGVISVQAGIVYRSRLTFDVSFIPRGTIINSAFLSLDVVPASTQLTSFTTDTTMQAHVALSDDPSNIEALGAVLRPTSSTLTTMTGDISHAVQFWLRGRNYGLVLRNTYPGETSRLDLYGLSGAQAANATTKPRLKITYSTGN
jgi:hypothetical protein